MCLSDKYPYQFNYQFIIPYIHIIIIEKVKGKGGHGAAPQGTVDAIVEAAHLGHLLFIFITTCPDEQSISRINLKKKLFIFLSFQVTSLQTVISRNKDPLENGVLTCGTINGGYGYNIIADQVSITGTCRSFTKVTQETIKSRMDAVCCGVANTFGNLY